MVSGATFPSLSLQMHRITARACCSRWSMCQSQCQTITCSTTPKRTRTTSDTSMLLSLNTRFSDPLPSPEFPPWMFAFSRLDPNWTHALLMFNHAHEQFSSSNSAADRASRDAASAQCASNGRQKLLNIDLVGRFLLQIVPLGQRCRGFRRGGGAHGRSHSTAPPIQRHGSDEWPF